MTSQLQAKLDKALAALRELHADTSGPVLDNLEAMHSAAELTQELISLLEYDVSNQEGKYQ